MEKSALNHGGTFPLKNECSFRLSGHASPAQRKPDSNSSCRSPVTALQKLGRNLSIYPRFISMLQEDFRLAHGSIYVSRTTEMVLFINNAVKVTATSMA